MNIVMFFLPHEKLISFLKCRVCLVYIFFAFIGCLQIFVLLALAALSATVAAADASASSQGQDVDTGSAQAMLWVLILLVAIQLSQGITWVLYTNKLAEIYWNELNPGSYSKV